MVLSHYIIIYCINVILYYIILYYIVLYCINIILYCIILYLLYYIVLYYIILGDIFKQTQLVSTSQILELLSSYLSDKE